MNRLRLGIVSLVFGVLGYAIILMMIAVWDEIYVTYHGFSIWGWLSFVVVGLGGLMISFLAVLFMGMVMFFKKLPVVTLLKIE